MQFNDSIFSPFQNLHFISMATITISAIADDISSQPSTQVSPSTQLSVDQSPSPRSAYQSSTLPIGRSNNRLALSLRETLPTAITTVDFDSKLWVRNRYKDTSLCIFRNQNNYNKERSGFESLID